MGLAILYPQYTFAIQLHIFLDVFSHWLHMYLSVKGGDHSHKDTSKQSRLLTIYYTNRAVLFTICSMNEIFFMSVYAAYWKVGPTMRVPLMTTKGQPLSIPLPWIIGGVCFPVFLLKNVLSMLQMSYAVRALAAMGRDGIPPSKKIPGTPKSKLV